jgi:hypothetical protein
MEPNQIKIFTLLKALVADDDYEIIPATEKQLSTFVAMASEREVDQLIIEQMLDLYRVVNKFGYEITLAFHSCDDSILFEWWDHKEIWLGQRDFNTLRWANGKFCLGDASNVSFSEKYEFATLIELIEGCIADIEEADYFGRRNTGS